MIKCPQCHATVVDDARFCPACGASLADSSPSQPAPLTAHRKRHAHNNGGGCLVALIGLLVVWVFPIGTILGVLLIIIGSRISYRYVCSNCGNPVETTSRQCPSCQARLT